MATKVTPRPVGGIIYNQINEEFNAPGVTSWSGARFFDEIMAGIAAPDPGSGHSAAGAVVAQLEIGIPNPDGNGPDIVVANSEQVSGNPAADPNASTLVDLYDLPGPVFVRWRIISISGGYARVFVTGKGW